MADRYLVPRRLDDPELIGFWTIDEFAGILIPFAWGILSQHIFIGIGLAAGAWLALRKAKARGAGSALVHAAYWYPMRRNAALSVFSLMGRLELRADGKTYPSRPSISARSVR